MTAMKTAIRRMGNSRRPQKKAREGWAEASQKIAAEREDKLVWPEFANEADAELQW